MSNKIYNKIRNEHNLDKALEDFNYIIKSITK